MDKLLFLFFLVINFSSQSNDKIEINADQFTYDKENTRIYATGNVEIIDKEFKLFANKVFVNNESKVLSARENIKIFNVDGSILIADKIVADNTLENALIENNHIYIPRIYKNEKQYLRLAAKKVERRNKDWEKLQYGTFTACELCYNEKKKKYDPPLIQLKAKKIIHDKKKLDVKYYDAFLDVNGKSVFYLPYFSHPSPLVKRKKGFLPPSIFQTHYFGIGADLPYYYPFSDFSDVTVTSKFSQKKNPAFLIQHRKNFKNGEIRNELSGTIENQETNQIKENRKRGHINSEGIFFLNPKNYASYKLQRTTDRNYKHTYKYKYDHILESNIKLESLRGYNSYSLESYLFQDTRREFNRRQTPRILPRLLLNWRSQPLNNTLNYDTNIEFINFYRTKGTETKKFFINQNFTFPTILNDGTLLKLGAHLNAGLYNIRKYSNPVNGKFEHNEYKNNFFPQISLEVSKPYFKNSQNLISTFTPKVLFVKSTKNAFNRSIPDENNINNFDLDFIDLFNVNRMHGTDRLEQSSRIDYGVSYASTKKDSFNDLTTIQIGQSHQFNRNKYLNKNTGINEKFSDIVGNFTLKPTKSINLNSYFVIDKDSFSIKTAYSNLLIRQKDSYLSIGNSRYSAVINEDGENLIDGKNQFSVKYGQKFYDFWNFTVYSTFDKKGKIKLYNYGTKIKYEDECFGMSFTWTRQYTHNPEDPTSNNFVFLFSLKEIMESDL